MVKFGERMKAARTAKHMSQQALADIIGKSLNTVGLYERGLRQPSLETLCLLADTLEVSSDYLLARTDVKRTATFSGVSESDLAARVARIENHLGLNGTKSALPFRKAERRLRRTCIARPLFCRIDERIFVKLVKSLTYSRAICKIETVTACERKAGL